LQNSGGGEAENLAKAVGTTLLGGAVKVAVDSLDERPLEADGEAKFMNQVYRAGGGDVLIDVEGVPLTT